MHFRELTDRYSLDKILRSTRTGTVLRATDTRSGQAVAIKLVNVASPVELMQKAPWFEKLVAALDALRHPNLPLVLDSGFTTEGSAFLVMELLEGRTLDTAAGPPQRLLALLYQALHGLEALARRGLAHHNLSPDNLFLVAGSDPERVKIFGLGTGIFRGTDPGAPENARFRAPEITLPALGEVADWRADLYSFAASACQVLGATIAAGESPVVQLPFALTLELDHSEELRQTLERALRRRPVDRPSHHELRDAFRLSLGAEAPPAVAEQKPAAAPAVPRLVVPAAGAPPPAQGTFGSVPPGPSATPRPVAAPGPAAPPPHAAPAVAASAVPQAPPTPSAPRPVPPLQGSPGLPNVGAASAAAPLPATDLDGGLDGTGGELLSSIDDDLLNALSPALAPASPAHEPPAATQQAASNVVPFQRKAGAPMAASVAEKAPDPASRQRRAIALISVAFGLVLALGLAYWWFSRETPPAQPAAVVAAPVPPPPPPRRAAADVLADAQLAFADGDDAKVLELLRSLTPADQSTLGEAGCRALQSLQDTELRSAVDHLPEALAQGLKGDLGRLRFAVAATAGQEAAIPAALQADWSRARGLVDLYAQIEEAAGRNATVEVLERFAVLERDLPQATDPLALRDHAAATLEDEAEALARDGKYQEAASHLEPLQRTWPTRAGLKARLDGYQAAEKQEATQEAILADVPALERQHLLDQALDKLRSVTPTPHLAAQFSEARTRIETALAQVDGQPPEIVLRDGYYLDYDRGRVVQLSFRITDDFKVSSVKLMARPAGGKMRQMPLEATRRDYTVVFPPAFHQNGTVEFYLVATDPSGHESYFGTPDKPKQLKRREGFKRLL